MDDIRCPYCRREVPVSEVNMQRLVGRCLECGKLFDLQEAGLVGNTLATSPPRPRVAQPKEITIQESMRGQQIRLRWFGPEYLAMAFFCLFWDGFLVVWYTIALSAPRGVDLVALLFPLLHVAAGVFITYTTLAGFLNTTTIELGDDKLRISHGPLPWKGNRELDSRELQQLFVVEKTGNKGRRYYELCALLKDNTKVHLISQSLDRLRFIEQHIESLLRIRDVRVLGEHAG